MAYCIVKMVKSVNGVELPVILLDSHDEVWEFVAEEIYDIDTSSEEFTVIDMASLNGDEVLYRLIQMNKDGARYIHQKAFLEFISPTGSLELKDEIINIKA